MLSITCLCLTRNRRGWLERAIKCFLGQSYEKRKLLILADGEDISDLVPDDPRISLVTFPEDGRPSTIGEKRNVGCAMVDTDLICNWDDDDFNSPGRIEDQVQRMVATGCQVTGYRVLRFKDGPHWWEYAGVPGWAAGTSLCFRREWWEKHPFPQIHVGEDNEFVRIANDAGVLVTSDGGAFITAAIWMGNTSKKCTTGPTWKKIPTPDYESQLSI